MLRFLEETSRILEPDQFLVLAEFLAEQRGRMEPAGGRGRAGICGNDSGRGPASGSRWNDGADSTRLRRLQRISERQLERLEARVEGASDFLGRVLGLSTEQLTSLRAVVEGTVPARRGVIERVGSGSLSPADAAAEMARINEGAAASIRALLSEEQTRRFDALIRLLPAGFPGSGGRMGSATF